MDFLSEAQCHQFIEDGFVLVPGVFDRALAEAGSAVVAEALTRHRDGWSSPQQPAVISGEFVHLQYGWRDGPFEKIPNATLLALFDDLVGRGRWTWDHSFGWWPVLLPGFAADASFRDLGWHVDSDDLYPTLQVPEKAMVAIFYFSDVEPGDGGTAVFRRSHDAVAKILAAAATHDSGFAEVRPEIPVPTREDEVVEVTGRAGDVLFAHPFLVHASNRNVGRRVRFACNPHVDLCGPMEFERPWREQSLVERAVTEALRSG